MDSWPNQEALNKALNIYRAAMRSFIVSRLKQIPGTDLESTVTSSFHRSSPRVDEIHRILFQTGRNIESVIDINDFPHLVNRNWEDAFETLLNDDKIFRNQLWLIVEGRNHGAHPGDVDIESEFTRVHLFLIADVLRKINKSDAKCKVEAIRDALFFHDTKERLGTMEADTAKYKKSLTEVEKHLKIAKSEKSKYEEENARLSKQIDENTIKLDEKEKRLNKLSKQLKRARAENDKYKKNLAGTKQRLEKPEAAQADYKKRLEVALDELKDTKEESRASEESLTAAEEHLTTATFSTKVKQREKKPSIAERYTAETTEETRDELAVKVAELRINASGSKPLSWCRIREKLGLKNDQFHKVIRLSEGYRTAVINRIKSLKAQEGGWDYNGKLKVLTGIEIVESELA